MKSKYLVFLIVLMALSACSKLEDKIIGKHKVQIKNTTKSNKNFFDKLSQSISKNLSFEMDFKADHTVNYNLDLLGFKKEEKIVNWQLTDNQLKLFSSENAEVEVNEIFEVIEKKDTLELKQDNLVLVLTPIQ